MKIILVLPSLQENISPVMDANLFQNEKLSIKNLLFTKAIPNYTLPVPTDGRPLFACTDCGDKFIIKSSYEYHIRRKSLKITYFCRHCNAGKVFFNRCDLLSHIRSHAFKTATISISDLKIEPLPLTYYNYQIQTDCEPEAPSLPLSSEIQDDSEVQNETKTVVCYDCKKNIYCSGTIYKDRAKHYTQYRNILYSCPICLLTLTTKCALEAHLRIHNREPPYYCPDCGLFLTKKAVVYPYTHDCESFKMMRATAKQKCLVNNCNRIFHPSESFKHLRSSHLKSVFKCPTCSVACYKLDNIQKHLNTFHGKLKQIDSRKIKHIDFLQCEMCPGRLVIPSQIDRHLKSHESNYINSVYPCWTCGATFKLAKNLLEHQEFKHPDIYREKIHGKVTQETIVANSQNFKTSMLRRTSTKCDKCCKKYSAHCRTTIICKCRAESIQKIVCNLCKVRITQDWNVIKKHFAIYHKEHVCLDAKILLKKIFMNKKKRTTNYSKKHKKVNHEKNISGHDKTHHVAPEIRKNPIISIDNNKFVCSKCGQGFENKESLEKHIVEHRDPFMAYQCMECGESFVAKPSFTTHLLLKHRINDVNNYINQKKCYSVESLNVQKPVNNEENKPVKENQCNICREQFCNSTDFEKHFRVHGMAFLMKNTNKPPSPEKV